MPITFLKSRGSLLIGVIFLIVAISGILALVGNIAVTTRQSTANQVDASQAYYVATAGAQRAAYALTASDPTQRTACASLTTFSNVAVGNGTYSITAAQLYKPSSPTTLQANISTSSTVIPVNSLTGYAASGRIMIDREMIDYGATSSNSGTCGGLAPCFIQLSRSAPAAHYSGTPVGQNLCQVTVQGTVSSAVRQITFNALNLDSGWAVYAGTNFGYWDGSTWTWGVYGYGGTANLTAVTTLSYADAWSVGSNGGAALALHWNGNAWSSYALTGSPTPSQLNSVSCSDGSYCWMVGSNSSFVYYNGSNATIYNPNNGGQGSYFSGVPTGVTLNSVSCPSRNVCWAVGNSNSGNPLLLKWNAAGSQWIRATTGNGMLAAGLPNDDLGGISCADDTHCSASGLPGSNTDIVIFKLSGGQWSNVTPASPPKGQLNTMSCIDSNHCWTAGQVIGPTTLVMTTSNGSTWTQYNNLPSTNATMNGISCTSSTNCLVVGDNATIMQYNGSTWSMLTPNIGASAKLTGVSIVNASTQPNIITSWQE